MRRVLLLLVGAIFGAIGGLFLGGFIARSLNASLDGVVVWMLSGVGVCAFAMSAAFAMAEKHRLVRVPSPILGAIAGFCLSVMIGFTVNPTFFHFLLMVACGTVVGLILGVLSSLFKRETQTPEDAAHLTRQP